MKLDLKTGVDFETGEIQDAKEQEFIQDYFQTAEQMHILKATMRGLRKHLDAVYEEYEKYKDEKRQGKLFAEKL